MVSYNGSMECEFALKQKETWAYNYLLWKATIFGEIAMSMI